VKDKLIKRATQINLILLAIQVLMIVSIWQFLPPKIPLFYSCPWGKDQLTNYPGVITLPAICLIIFFTNLVIAKLVTKKKLLIKQILITASLIFTLLILISLVQIIRLVT